MVLSLVIASDIHAQATTCQRGGNAFAIPEERRRAAIAKQTLPLHVTDKAARLTYECTLRQFAAGRTLA